MEPFIVLVQHQQVFHPVPSSGFINSRNIAFSKAVLRAKVELLKLSGESITTQKNFSLVNKLKNGNDQDAIQKASLVDKMEALADKSLDNALVEVGVNELEVEKMNQEQKEKKFEEKYYYYVASLVSSMIRGIVIYKIVEGEIGNNDYQVAVCIEYSLENQNFSARFKELGATPETLESSLIKKIENAEQSKLIPKLGAQIITDSLGNRYIVGFGQSSLPKQSSRQSTFDNIGYQKAKLNALENIKSLIAENLIGKQSEEDIEKILEYSSGEQGYYSENTFIEMIESKKSSLKLNTLEIKRWKGTHPANSESVYGSVVILLKENIIPKTTTGNNDKTTKGNFLESQDF
jgi:hypothetical protein